MEWTEQISPGITESELLSGLSKMGIRYWNGPEGFTYSSMTSTEQRDYLFCEDRLYAMVEGVFVSGKEFIKWFQAFLAAHQIYGKPKGYVAEEDWSRFRAEWNLEDGSTFYLFRTTKQPKR